MKNQLLNHLENHYPNLWETRLLLAVSGGIDSMVLLDLLHKLNLNITIAHCNFKLRGQDSQDDKNFVVSYAQNHNIPFFVKDFDTESFAQEQKLSIQLAARKLRYDWFFELKEQHGFDYIVTAHHLDDSLETFFINLSRGTGLEGLLGIRENENVIRPLLDFSKSEIHHYALENNLSWREDISNASDKYLRNKIRHHLVPVLKEINPDFLQFFQKTRQHLQASQNFTTDVLEEILNKVLVETKNTIILDINKLNTCKNKEFILYQWLSSYGFRAWNDIYDLLEAQSGKFVDSENYRLLKNRNELVLSTKNNLSVEEEFYIQEGENEVNHPIKLRISEVETMSKINNPEVIYVDKNLLIFPLSFRKWQKGDYFYPFGMNGKSKKISKFFKDEKLSLFEKENTWLLCSENQIIWVVGKRLDHRFAVTETTKSILKIEHLS
jgi:tRNA(Ile)-lysidine synthase